MRTERFGKVVFEWLANVWPFKKADHQSPIKINLVEKKHQNQSDRTLTPK